MESVTGLSPAIAIEQRTTVSHPRSTVGTVTEIYDHLRVLFAALGRPHCPRCARADRAPRRAEQIADSLLRHAPGAPVAVLAPVVRGPQGRLPARSWRRCARAGYRASRMDGRARRPGASRSPLDPRRNHRIEVLVDRLVLRAGRARSGCAPALEQGPAPGRRRGRWSLSRARRSGSTAGGWPACECDVSVPELSPARVLLQQPLRRLPGLRRPGRALGRGRRRKVMPDEDALAARRRDPSLAAPRAAPGARGARGRGRAATASRSRRRCASCRRKARAGPAAGRRQRLPGRAAPTCGAGWRPLLRLDARRRRGGRGRDGGEAFEDLRPYLTEAVCPECAGARLRRESLAVRLGGRTHRRLRAAARRPRRVPRFDALDVRGARAAGGGPAAARDPSRGCGSWTRWASAT